MANKRKSHPGIPNALALIENNDNCSNKMDINSIFDVNEDRCCMCIYLGVQSQPLDHPGCQRGSKLTLRPQFVRIFILFFYFLLPDHFILIFYIFASICFILCSHLHHHLTTHHHSLALFPSFLPHSLSSAYILLLHTHTVALITTRHKNEAKQENQFHNQRHVRPLTVIFGLAGFTLQGNTRLALSQYT